MSISSRSCTFDRGQGVRSALIAGWTTDRQVLRCLGLTGRLVVWHARRRADRIPARDLTIHWRRSRGSISGTGWRSSHRSGCLAVRAVKRLTAEGVFQVDVSEVYPLEQVSAAVAASSNPAVRARSCCVLVPDSLRV
jgi:NADPH:quinone reductase-like Zn-dependent oxidoreductase